MVVGNRNRFQVNPYKNIPVTTIEKLMFNLDGHHDSEVPSLAGLALEAAIKQGLLSYVTDQFKLFWSPILKR